MIQAARITNWFSRQNGSASQRRGHGDLESSTKTFDAFVQTDDDASRAVIAGAAFFCAPCSTMTLVCVQHIRRRLKTLKSLENLPKNPERGNYRLVPLKEDI